MYSRVLPQIMENYIENEMETGVIKWLWVSIPGIGRMLWVSLTLSPNPEP